MEIKRNLLKTLIHDNKYNYGILADIIGCSRVFMWQIINGKRRLTYEMAIKISTIFNMTPDDIFYSECKENKEMKLKLNAIKKSRDSLFKK